MLHYKAVAKSALWKWADIVLGIFGFIAMAYTTSQTVMSWANSGEGGGLPSHCDTKGLHP
jgi:solute carrier family 36 (proton-coupled amino acid transporter)